MYYDQSSAAVCVGHFAYVRGRACRRVMVHSLETPAIKLQNPAVNIVTLASTKMHAQIAFNEQHHSRPSPQSQNYSNSRAVFVQQHQITTDTRIIPNTLQPHGHKATTHSNATADSLHLCGFWAKAKLLHNGVHLLDVIKVTFDNSSQICILYSCYIYRAQASSRSDEPTRAPEQQS
jgi:hypothetical protein